MKLIAQATNSLDMQDLTFSWLSLFTSFRNDVGIVTSVMQGKEFRDGGKVEEAIHL